jgi:hypothetical protein
MNCYYLNMVIKKLIQTTPKPLNLLKVGGPTPLRLITLMPVSESISL